MYVHKDILWRLLALLAAGFSLSGTLFAQQVEWSSAERLSRKINTSEVLGANTHGYFVFFGGDDEPYINHYSERLNLQKKIPLRFSHNVMQIRNISLSFDHIHVFYMAPTAGDRPAAFVQTIGLKSESQTRTEKLFTLPEVAGKKKTGRIYVNKSDDHTRYLLAGIQPEAENGVGWRIGAWAVNYKLESLWDTWISVPVAADEVQLRKAIIDEDGDAHFLLRTKHKNQKKQSPERFQYHLFSYFPESDSIYLFDIQVRDYLLTDVHMIYDAVNEDVVVAGFYAYDAYNEVDGSFMTVLHKPLRRIEMVTVQHAEDIYAKLSSGGTEGRAIRKRMDNYVLQDLILRHDGGIILVGEVYYTTVVSQTAPNFYHAYSMYETTYYHYNDLLVVSIGPDGRVDWQERIKKRQSTEHSRNVYVSYAHVVTADRLGFVFNDEISRNNNVILGSLTHDGQLTVKSLFKDMLTVKWAKQISPDVLLVPSLKRNTYRLVKITF